MKKKILRAVALIALMATLTSLFSACDEKEKSPITLPNLEEDEKEVVITDAEGELTIFKDGVYNVQFIYSENLTTGESWVATQIKNLIQNKTGVNMETLKDGDGKYGGAAIIIGKTSHAESIAAYEGLASDAAKTVLIGNKLVFAFHSQDTGSKLVDAFGQNIRQKASVGEVKVNAEWNYECRLSFNADGNALFDHTSLVESAQVPYSLMGTRYDAGQGSYTYLKRNATRSDFDKILEALDANRFGYYTSNAIGNNLFATYITKKQIVHVMYFPNKKEIRTAIDKRGEGKDGFALTGLSGENQYADTHDSCMTLVEIENADWPGGLSMIFKLADGSFFIIDSGVGGRDNNGSSSGWIWASLAKHADNPYDIRVAAWLITHVHSDHAGGLYDMAKGYYEKKNGTHTVMPQGCTSIIKIEKLIYNSPANMSKFGRSSWINTIIDAFDIKQVVKAHPGQEFWVANLKMTVYGSQDLILEQDSQIDNLNEYSVVTMIDFNGKRILSLGDAYPKCNLALSVIYKEELKADVIQVAHHGYGDTGAGAVNNYCNPDIVLWPVAKGEMSNAHCKEKAINAIFLDKLNYAPHGGNMTFDENWEATLIPNSEILKLIPVCPCGCGKKSSYATS